MPGPVSTSYPGPPSSKKGSQIVTLTCAFCGKEYPAGTPATKHKALTEHIFKCEKHPLGEVIECLGIVLDCVDYTAPIPNCKQTEMIGAVLPKEILERARKAIHLE